MTVPNLVEAATALFRFRMHADGEYGKAYQALADALAALPTDQGPLVCVSAALIEEAYRFAGTMVYILQDPRGKAGANDLAARLRSVCGEKP